ncbi:MAG: FG-GAP-like repeat-containing protein [Myxococcota bacterium]
MALTWSGSPSLAGLRATESWTADPTDQSTANFGSSASAGDVNGDGYADLVVGAPSWDDSGAGRTDEGRAYLFLGGATGLATVPAWTADPTDQTGSRFGWAVAGVGDVNGDGFADVLVGSDGFDGEAADEGRAYLFLGSAAGLEAAPSWVADPTDLQGAFFGFSVSGAGDLNGDEYADVVVGASGWSGPGALTNQGKVYVYLGGPGGLASSPSRELTAPDPQPDAWFGASVSGAGDINGDGFGDVVVGAYLWDDLATARTNEGRVYLFQGGMSGLSLAAAWTADSSDQAFALFGYSVAGAGDVNADGYADVLVGAAGWDGPGSFGNEGRAYLFLGSQAGLSNSPVWFDDPTDQFSARYGSSVAGVGDVNGDGYSDVLVGAPSWDSAVFASEGRAHLYLGSASGLRSALTWTADPADQVDAWFGVSVAGAGDVNGDGFGDVVVGASEWNGSQPDEGRAYVYLGFAEGLTPTNFWTVAPTNQAGAAFGAAVASAGDVNGDGFGDVLIGAKDWNGQASDEGRVYLFLGGATGLATSPAWTADPTDESSAELGNSLSAAGDVNGDGYGDVVIGAYRADNQAANEGRAYVYWGGPTATGLSLMPAWVLDPTDQAGSFFGDSVAGAGDVNGDGFADVLVSADEWSGEAFEEGRGYLFLGGPTGLATTPAWVLDPTDQAGAWFSFPLAGAGDVNGDGLADALLGAFRWDGAQPDEGRAYIFLGNAGGLELVGTPVDPTDQAGAEFGRAVAAAGDVNGDGRGDLLIGARAFDGTELNEGGAYLYWGGDAGVTLATSLPHPAPEVDAGFGAAVAGGVDFNGDGFADVAIGAPRGSGSVAGEGAIYAYAGSAGPLAGARFDPVDQQGANFGAAVASAGDVNADGFGDLLVGAPGWDGSSNAEGRAYVFFGGDGAPGAARGLAQLRDDGVTRIGLGASAGPDVTLMGRVGQESPLGGMLRLEVEVKNVGVPFDGRGTVQSLAFTAGAVARVLIANLSPGAKHWRARVIYPVRTGFGRWVPFGGNSEAETDFRVLCPAGMTTCANACVDLGSDSNHCGQCGAACAAGALCVKGACAQLPAEETVPGDPTHYRVGCGCEGGVHLLGVSWWVLCFVAWRRRGRQSRG